MTEASAMLQIGQHAIDQQKEALAPDPGPKLSVPRFHGWLVHHAARPRRPPWQTGNARRCGPASHPGCGYGIADRREYWVIRRRPGE